MPKRLAMLAALAALTLPAAAQARPTLHPTRDVMVRYQITGDQPGHTGEVTIRYADHGQRMRIEPAGRPGYMIVDRIADQMEMVMPAKRIYVDLPYDPHALMSFEDPNAHFTRRGTDSVAGLACTAYAVESHGNSGEVCVTEDGVLLRASRSNSQRHGSLQALKVAYGPQPAALFAPPPGFQKMEVTRVPNSGQGTPPR